MLRSICPVAVLVPARVVPIVMLLAAGCSQTTTTQDRPGWSLTGSVEEPKGTTESDGSAETASSADAYEAGLATAASATGGSYTREPLPPPAPIRNEARTPPALPAPAAYPEVPPAAEPAAAVDRGHSIVVAPGDTLFAISRRHGVGVKELMVANGLADGAIKSGQSLTIPVR